jgi:site-specific recombinase XerD
MTLQKNFNRYQTYSIYRHNSDTNALCLNLNYTCISLGAENIAHVPEIAQPRIYESIYREPRLLFTKIQKRAQTRRDFWFLSGFQSGFLYWFQSGFLYWLLSGALCWLLSGALCWESNKKEGAQEQTNNFQQSKNKKSHCCVNQTLNKEPTKNTITIEELSEIIKWVPNHFKEKLIIARVRIAIMLLYITGLRISSLLSLRKKDIKSLVSDQQCEIFIAKSSKKQKTTCKQFIYIGEEGSHLLRELNDDLTILYKNQPNEEGPIFVGQNKQKLINLRNFCGSINKVLQFASQKLNKRLRSHNFRITYTTDFLSKGARIEEVKDIVGHSNIKSTSVYSEWPQVSEEVKKDKLKKIITEIQSLRVKKQIAEDFKFPLTNFFLLPASPLKELRI